MYCIDPQLHTTISHIGIMLPRRLQTDRTRPCTPIRGGMSQNGALCIRRCGAQQHHKQDLWISAVSGYSAEEFLKMYINPLLWLLSPQHLQSTLHSILPFNPISFYSNLNYHHVHCLLDFRYLHPLRRVLICISRQCWRCTTGEPVTQRRERNHP